jgi:hypothetical protein
MHLVHLEVDKKTQWFILGVAPFRGRGAGVAGSHFGGKEGPPFLTSVENTAM